MKRCHRRLGHYEICRAEHRLLPASVVDHRIPHGGDARLFWDQSNWQALSKRCHDRKTATYDGGFGNTRRSLDDLT